MEHLSPDIQLAAQAGNAQRIKSLAVSPVIGYPLAKRAMDRLEDLLVHPPTHRMPNLLLVGNTNNGKTIIASRFLAQHQAYSLPDEDFVRVPVVMIQAPPVPDEKQFYNGILKRLASPYKINDKIDRKQYQVLQLLANVQARMLIIDEIHHILAGNLTKQRAFLNVIKYLANELQIPIVAIGTKDAFRAIHTDPQLANRFEPHLLPRWRDGEDYRRLLASFERKLPLRKSSYLESDELGLKILSMSEGAIGEISNLLRQAAIQAIHSGQECITVRLLESIGWQAPSQRKAAVNLMN